MRQQKLLLGLLSILFVLLMVSCTKDDTTNNNNNTNNTTKQKVLGQVLILEPGDSSFIAFEYNSSKKISKMITKDGAQAITEIVVYNYDASGKMINTKTYSDAAMSILTSQTSFTYSGTLLTSAVELGEFDTINYTFLFANSKLAVVEEITSSEKTKTTYTWTGENITKEETMFDDLSGSGYVSEGYTNYTHDAKINPMFKMGIITNEVTFLNKNNYLKASYFDPNGIPMMSIDAVYTYDGDYPKTATIDFGFESLIYKFSYIEI